MSQEFKLASNSVTDTTFGGLISAAFSVLSGSKTLATSGRTTAAQR